MIPLAQEGSPVGPAIISASAALVGVCLAQAISAFQRRTDERRRRRTEIAGVVARTLSLITEATEQIELGRVAQTNWYQQPAWRKLREDDWRSVRTMLLEQAAQETSSSGASFDDLAQRIQGLLTSDDGDANAALVAWQDARHHVLALRDSRLPGDD
jgi:hypothetical protein